MTPTGEPALEGERARRFEEMFDRHAGRVYAYASRRSRPDVANEVVGETFLIAWRKLDAVPAEPLPHPLRVWIAAAFVVAVVSLVIDQNTGDTTGPP